MNQQFSIIGSKKRFLINEKTNIYVKTIVYVHFQISQFLATLEQDLPNVTSIDSILGQCTYFSHSFGRVGADFTARMADIFIKIVHDKFKSSINTTTKKFQKDMESFTLINKFQRNDMIIESGRKSVSAL